MKLKSAQVSDYRCVRDACSFDVSDITCLVGKNESGKTTILEALYKLNPIIPEHGDFDVDDDFPRVDVEDYRLRVSNKERQPATVIKARYALEAADLAELDAELPGLLEEPELVLSKGYQNEVVVELPVSEEDVVACLVRAAAELPSKPKSLARVATLEDLAAALKPVAQEEPAAGIMAAVAGMRKKGVAQYLFDRYLAEKLPKFLYFNEFYQMEGHVNVEALIERRNSGKLLPSDYPLLGLIDLARMDIEEICNPKRALQRDNRLEGASNHLTRSVMKYWSQNRFLEMRFDIRPGLPNDPPGMRTGTNLWGHVYNSKQRVTTLLGKRSSGFVWFYSFLAWFSAQKRSGRPLILLLDEPGIHLHGTAQKDLLRYLEDECASGLQVVYTTQSPFMIDHQHLERVRIVEDRSVEDPEFTFTAGKRQGTQVYTDVMQATAESKLPLLGALGHKLVEKFSPGQHLLLVESIADFVYLRTMSALVREESGAALDARWTITPMGGISRLGIFFGLTQRSDARTVAGVFSFADASPQDVSAAEKEILRKESYLSYEYFADLPAADVEDLLDPEFYLDLVNAEYAESLRREITTGQLRDGSLKITEKIAAYLAAHPLANGATFRRDAVALHFLKHITPLGNRACGAETLKRFQRLFEALNSLLPVE